MIGLLLGAAVGYMISRASRLASPVKGVLRVDSARQGHRHITDQGRPPGNTPTEPDAADTDFDTCPNAKGHRRG